MMVPRSLGGDMRQTVFLPYRVLFAFFTIVLLLGLAPSAFAREKSCPALLENNSPFVSGSSELKTKWVEQELQNIENSADPERKMVRQANQEQGIDALSLNREIIQNHNSNYTHKIETACITNQYQSGRCWLFASLNMLRPKLLAANLVDEKFEFSENYLYFFAMLEKSNSFLKTSETAVRKYANNRRRLLNYINRYAYVGDGGYYQWFVYLAEKYGLVPKSAMQEASGSVDTEALTADLQRKLLLVTEQMRQRVLQGGSESKIDTDLRAIREAGLRDVMVMLVTHLGTPPQEFSFRIAKSNEQTGKKNSKTKKSKSSPLEIEKAVVKKFTPQTFARKFAKFDPNEYVTLFYNPRFAPNKFYELTRSKIGIEKAPKTQHAYSGLNLPIERIEQLIVKSIDSGQSLYFASDVLDSADFSPKNPVKPVSGILHPKLFNHDPIYGFTGDRSLYPPRRFLDFYRLIAPTHAMVIVGYDRPDPHAPVIKFLVENSWGKRVGDEGYLHMYREWLYQDVFAVTIRRDLLNPEEQKALRLPPTKVRESEW